MQRKGENCIVKSILICTCHQYYSGDQIKKNEMGGTYGVFGRGEKCIQNFGAQTRTKEAT